MSAPVVKVRASHLSDNARNDARAMAQQAQLIADRGEHARAARMFAAVASAHELIAQGDALAAYRALCGVVGYVVEVVS